jgi:Zn finger protein HypA/HybF involved in hydrogenase expression
MYVKITVGDEFATQNVEIDLNAQNIYAQCPKCGKEFLVDPIEWAHDFPEFDWEHIPICDKCSSRKSS